MAKKKIISAIDAGNTKVCTLVAEAADDGQIRIAGVGIVPSKGIHKGAIVNVAEAKETIRDSIKRAEQSSGHRVESAYVGVTGHHIVGQNYKGFVAIIHNDHIVRPDDIRRVLQVEQISKPGSNQKILHVIPRLYAVDGQEEVQNPIGMSAFKLEAETHVITAPVSPVQELVRCIMGVDVNVEDLVFNGLASGEAVLTGNDKQAGTIMADIGAGTTNIIVYKDGTVWHSAVIPVGGNQVTEDLAIGLNLSFDIVDEMKKKFGTAFPVYEGRPENESITLNGHSAPYKGLCDIIRARMEELLRLIIMGLPQDEKNVLLPGGLALTGGGSNLAGIQALGNEILKMPLRISAPLNVYGAGDQLNDPAYSTAIGLLNWGIIPKSNAKIK
jgi:cell division protein FtsA